MKKHSLIDFLTYQNKRHIFLQITLINQAIQSKVDSIDYHSSMTELSNKVASKVNSSLINLSEMQQLNNNINARMNQK